MDPVTKPFNVYSNEKEFNDGVQLIEHHLGLYNALVRDAPYGNIYVMETDPCYKFFDMIWECVACHFYSPSEPPQRVGRMCPQCNKKRLLPFPNHQIGVIKKLITKYWKASHYGMYWKVKACY